VGGDQDQAERFHGLIVSRNRSRRRTT
jgi:hypothetical protein